MRIKQRARIRKAMNVYGLFFVLAAVLTVGEHTRAIQDFNKSNSGFWSDFHDVGDRQELEKYITGPLLDKFFGTVNNAQTGELRVNAFPCILVHILYTI